MRDDSTWLIVDMRPRSRRGQSFKGKPNARGAALSGEFWEYLSQNKKWWLTPIIVVLLLVGALIVLGGTAAAPFIYTLF